MTNEKSGQILYIIIKLRYQKTWKTPYSHLFSSNAASSYTYTKEKDLIEKHR